MDQRRLILLGALLLSLLAASFYWYDETTKLPAQQQARTKNLAPESIVSGFAQTTFSANGTRHYYLQADKVTHYARQAAAEMLKPDIRFFKGIQPTMRAEDQTSVNTHWQAKANNGLLNEKTETLTLTGNVEITKPLENNRPLNFTTESLTIKPGQEIATTDKAVTLTQSEHITTAKGLIIDINAGKVELLSQVRSQYVPAKR